MSIFRFASALMLGALLAAGLPACSKKNAESPANPPTGIETKSTPDAGSTASAPASSAAAAASPPAAQEPGR